MLLLRRLQHFAAALLVSLAFGGVKGDGSEMYYRAVYRDGFKWNFRVEYCWRKNPRSTDECLHNGNPGFNIFIDVTDALVENPTDASNKFDLSILHPKFDSIFPQIGFPVNTYAYSGAETEGQTDIRYPVSAVGSFENQASNKLPKINFEYIIITDPDRNCNPYRPAWNKPNNPNKQDIDDAISYINEVQASKAWLFVKERETLCFTSYEFSHMSSGIEWNGRTFMRDRYVTPSKYYLMKKYPTQNYLLKFFAIDSILGCFVSLWWDGNWNRDPEVHFFKFDESDPENFPTKPMDKLVLKDFDKNILTASRAGHFHNLYRPVLASFRGQIFVYVRHPTSGVGFIGHYMNSTLWTTHYERDSNSKIIPMNFYKDIPFVPPTQPPTTPSTTTTTTPAPTMTTSSTSTATITTSTTSAPKPQNPTSASSPMRYSTTSSKPTTSFASSPTVDPLHPTTLIQTSLPDAGQVSAGGSNSDDDSSDVGSGCSFIDECIWCFVTLIVLDVILVILLILLIILARRGSKKMKTAAMAKKHGKTESSKIKSHKKMKNKRKKKSATEIGTTVGAQTDGDEVSNSASKVSGTEKDRANNTKHETRISTITSYFQTAPKSKKKKKKSKK